MRIVQVNSPTSSSVSKTAMPACVRPSVSMLSNTNAVMMSTEGNSKSLAHYCRPSSGLISCSNRLWRASLESRRCALKLPACSIAQRQANALPTAAAARGAAAVIEPPAAFCHGNRPGRANTAAVPSARFAAGLQHRLWAALPVLHPVSRHCQPNAAAPVLGHALHSKGRPQRRGSFHFPQIMCSN